MTYSKLGYQSQPTTVVVGTSDVSGIRVNLSHNPRNIERVIDDQIRAGDPPCSGTSRACDAYSFGPHHDGDFRAFLVWKTNDANLELELRCEGQVVDQASRPGVTILELNTRLKGGRMCEIRVIHAGTPQLYTLFLTYLS